MNVKVITDGQKGDIIYQYVAFTRVVNQQIKLHGYTKRAIEETLRICKDGDILKEYLISCEKEVIDMLDVLFDHDFITETHNNTIRAEGMLSTLFNLVKDGILSLAEAAKRADMTPEEFQAKAGAIAAR